MVQADFPVPVPYEKLFSLHCKRTRRGSNVQLVLDYTLSGFNECLAAVSPFHRKVTRLVLISKGERSREWGMGD